MGFTYHIELLCTCFSFYFYLGEYIVAIYIGLFTCLVQNLQVHRLTVENFSDEKRLLVLQRILVF